MIAGEDFHFVLNVPRDLVPATKALFLSITHSLQVELVVDSLLATNLIASAALVIIATDQKVLTFTQFNRRFDEGLMIVYET